MQLGTYDGQKRRHRRNRQVKGREGEDREEEGDGGKERESERGEQAE